MFNSRFDRRKKKKKRKEKEKKEIHEKETYIVRKSTNRQLSVVLALSIVSFDA